MRPTANVTTTATAATNAAEEMVDGGFKRWNSPLPYLFIGLAFMLGLIALSLLVLACSFKKYSSDEDGGDKAEEMVAVKVDNEPKIVVIMAGDDNPTYLAKPVPAATNCQQV